MGDYLSGTKSKVILSLSTQTKQMTKYQQLESQIQELRAEVERLKQEEKAEQIDLSTCIAGQLVQLRNGQFDYYEFYCGVYTYYVIGGLTYDKDGRQYEYSRQSDYDVVKVFPAEIPVPDSFNAFYAKKVLKGDISRLNYTFTFTETPQGEQYWKDIYTGKTNLSFGDMIFIQKWVIQSL
jgi:outer membrane murein-binding lipoprotein Lpp